MLRMKRDYVELAGHDVLYELSLGGLGRYLPVSIMSPLNNDINLIGVLARKALFWIFKGY
jgi:hypothetical protein